MTMNIQMKYIKNTLQNLLWYNMKKKYVKVNMNKLDGWQNSAMRQAV